MNSEINSDWFVDLQTENGRYIRVIDAAYIAPEIADSSSDVIYAVVPGNPRRGDPFVITSYDPSALIGFDTARFLNDLARVGRAYTHTTPDFLELLENLRGLLNKGNYELTDWLKDPTAPPTV